MSNAQSRSQGGYILLSAMLLMTLLLITLSIELPRISQQIKRDKEDELIHRAQEYTRAIRKFYRKFGRYPLSIEQLENTNNMRFLRKRFKDPMTGKDDWRIIHVGEAMIKMGGTQTGNLNGQQGAGTLGQPNAGISSGSSSSQSAGSNQNSQNQGATPTGGSSGSSNSSAGSSGSAFGNFQPGGGPMIGIASSKKALSIKILNEKDHYNEWEFVYDPRQEQLQQQLGGGMNTPNNPNAGTGVGSGVGSGSSSNPPGSGSPPPVKQ